jgi:hypothetical protein
MNSGPGRCPRDGRRAPVLHAGGQGDPWSEPARRNMTVEGDLVARFRQEVSCPAQMRASPGRRP